MSLEQALAELDNANELRAFCDAYIASQKEREQSEQLEQLALALSNN
jgi:hypothetical protein